ncbi:hypothetical protein [Tabrizicola sp.]|uniref:hypothetical protein n=1 Tax=Tabrizicola sp. TaxID=2005166 RepID=UPI002FDDFAAD
MTSAGSPTTCLPLAQAFLSAVLLGRETILRDGQPVGYLTSGGYGYIRNPGGVTEDWLTRGRYSLIIAGDETPAYLALELLYDPKGDRFRA